MLLWFYSLYGCIFILQYRRKLTAVNEDDKNNTQKLFSLSQPFAPLNAFKKRYTPLQGCDSLQSDHFTKNMTVGVPPCFKRLYLPRT